MASKTNKATKYLIHKTHYQTFMSNKKYIQYWKKKYRKAPQARDIYKDMTDNARSINDSIAILVAAEELYWLNTGKKTVFLSDALIQVLLRAKFTTNENSTIIPFPDFESISIAVPKKCTHTTQDNREVSVTPFLVSLMTVKDYILKVKHNFIKETNLTFNTDPSMLKDKNEVILTVSYTDENGVTFQTIEQVKTVIQAMEDNLHNKSNLSSTQHLDEEERERMKLVLRLAMAFFIYSSAKMYKNIKSGYPEECSIPMEQGFRMDFWNALHCDYKNTSVTKNSSYKLPWGIRKAHLRNLTHEKYYRGEYKDWVRGSRWILVDEYEIGNLDTYHSN